MPIMIFSPVSNFGDQSLVYVFVSTVKLGIKELFGRPRIVP